MGHANKYSANVYHARCALSEMGIIFRRYYQSVLFYAAIVGTVRQGGSIIGHVGELTFTARLWAQAFTSFY